MEHFQWLCNAIKSCAHDRLYTVRPYHVVYEEYLQVGIHEIGNVPLLWNEASCNPLTFFEDPPSPMQEYIKYGFCHVHLHLYFKKSHID